MSKTLRSRFLSAEHQLLTSVTLGNDALRAFERIWVTLLSDLSAAIQLKQVDEETMSDIHAIVSQVVILADSLLHMDRDADQTLEAFKSQIDRILSDNEVEDLSPNSVSSFPPHPPPSPSLPAVDFYANPSLCTPTSIHFTAHRWLLPNLHDPYPSAVETASLAQACGCAVKAIQDWFSSARRRIGWTDLSREKFGGSRRETSQAASRAYAEDSDDALPSDIKHAFSIIRANARKLLQELVADLDGDGQITDSILGIQEFVAPLSVVEDDEDDMTPPPPIAGCKRTFSSSGESEDGGIGEAHVDLRPFKRHRPLKLSSSLNQSVPSTSHNQPAQVQYPFDCHGAGQVPMPTIVTAKASCSPTVDVGPIVAGSATSPRKRRLSYASSVERPKRPRGLDHGPRRQTVSDPLPSASEKDMPDVLFSEDWLNAAFGVPSAVDTSGLEASALFNIGLYDHNPATQSLNGMTVSPTCQYEVNDADLATAVVNSFDLSSMGITSTPQSTTGQSEYLETSMLSALEEPFNLSEYQSVSDSLLDWSQFDDIVRSLGSSSPTPSLTSLSSDSSASSTLEPLSSDSSLQLGYLPEADPTVSLTSCLSNLSSELPSLSFSPELIP
ncbi:hypothetical protein EVG20_g7522 [Dentipellis fragilis]|uniref:Homeobox KN domain-containing protein n=1 Tax=Dentipellis fragilis TaxID=205917 RepID=A0A4Y9YCA5_9AGAM|nr:hypothetical protein EVG20_g7522 [Dentipellis fragilis]